MAPPSKTPSSSPVPRPRWLPDPDLGESTFVGDVLRRETVGGTIALVAAVVAVAWASSPWSESYDALRGLQIGPLDVKHWASDGALTLFFFVAGLELKREFLVGSLRRPADAAVPVIAAVGGVTLPALIFLAFNAGTPQAGGWAIPAATDIAFALAVLAVVGSYLPSQLRAFLLTLAVVDDLIVIIIIAIFYSQDLHWPSLFGVIACLAAFAVLQRARVRSSLLYLPLVVTAWWLTYQSGIHATIVGVALGLLTRVRPDPSEPRSPAERLEHRLQPLSAGVAVPFFALCSAGVAVTADLDLASDALVLGVVLGLVVGKPVGVLAGAWLVTRLTRAELNEGLGWRDLVGVALLTGVGFTVSLLVAELSFDGPDLEAAKTAVLAGSLLAAVLASIVLRRRNAVHKAVQRPDGGSERSIG